MEIREWIEKQISFAGQEAVKLEKRKKLLSEIDELILERNSIECGLQLLFEHWEDQCKDLDGIGDEVSKDKAATIRLCINELHETCDLAGIG